MLKLLKCGLAVALLLACPPAGATQSVVKLGTTTNDGSGEPLRTAFTKLNANDAELYLSVQTLTTALAGKADTVHTHTVADVAGLSATLASLAPNASPALTGIPTAPTAALGANTTQIASTAFVGNALTAYAPLASPALTGTPTTPTAPVGTSTTQVANMAAISAAIASIPAGATIPAGQIRLAYTSTTALTVKPYQGNQLWVNGTFRTVPSAGFSCSNTGLTAGTLYYAYGYVSGSTLTCEMSTTAHATDPTYGHEIKAGDGTRTLLGMAYTGSGSPGVFLDAPATRYVASWFNRPPRPLLGTVAASSASSSNYVILSTGQTVLWINWADEAVDLSAIGSVYGSAAGVYMNTAVYVDGAMVGASSLHMSAANGSVGTNGAVAAKASVLLTEGYHRADVYGNAQGGSGNWSTELVGAVLH